MSFEHQIKELIITDNELKELGEKIKLLREKRNALEKELNVLAKTNDLTDKIVKFQDIKLKFVNTKVMEPLTFRYLDKTIGEIIKNPSQAQAIMSYIKEKREVKIVPEIKRIFNN